MSDSNLSTLDYADDALVGTIQQLLKLKQADNSNTFDDATLIEQVTPANLQQLTMVEKLEAVLNRLQLTADEILDFHRANSQQQASPPPAAPAGEWRPNITISGGSMQNATFGNGVVNINNNRDQENG